MEITKYTAAFTGSLGTFDATDPPELVEQVSPGEGEPLINVDPPIPEPVSYAIVLGTEWEAGAGSLVTTHGPKMTDGRRVVIRKMERCAVLRSSLKGQRIEIKAAEGVEVFIVRDTAQEPLTGTAKLDVLQKACEARLLELYPPPEPEPVVIPGDELTEVSGEMVPVGVDTDGVIKPLEELSYAEPNDPETPESSPDPTPTE